MLERLPSVDELLRSVADFNIKHEAKRNVARAIIAEYRKARRDPELIQHEFEGRLNALLTPSLRQVINATGVVLHTNLGRASLPNFKPVSGYSNLELDLVSGKRGKRDAHTAPLLRALLDRDAIVVNNNAAAVFLTLYELAQGGEVIVSRGELVEIGEGFRIPDIMMRSGALLREVGATNRTRVSDYEAAINERTRLILRVHPSNFAIRGFTERPGVEALGKLARQRGIPLYEDLGSGSFIEEIGEPLVRDSIDAGVNVVSFSCDKLLGGPQAGIIAGDETLIARIRKNPLYRAMRVDKLQIQAISETLRLLISEPERIPTLRILKEDLEFVRARAERIAEGLSTLGAEVIETRAVVGGGASPDRALTSFAVRLSAGIELETLLRGAEPPVIARIDGDRVLLDVRAVSDDEERLLVSSVLGAAAKLAMRS